MHCFFDLNLKAAEYHDDIVRGISSMKSTGLFFAVQGEAETILADIHYAWVKCGECCWRSENYPLKLVVSGIGKAFASYYLSMLTNDCSRIFIMGTSGGLADEKIGSLYLVSEFAEHDMDVSGLGFHLGVTPFCGMKSEILSNAGAEYIGEITAAGKVSGLDFLPGRAVSGDRFINSRELALKIKEAFTADLADMESAAVAKICWRIGKEVLALRYITDNADHEASNDWMSNVKKASVLFNKVLLALVSRKTRANM